MKALRGGFLVLFALLLPGQAALADLIRGQTLTSDNRVRSYDIYVPDHPGTSPMSLVFMFHGHMGSADVMTGENHRAAPYKVWLTLARRDRFIVVVPQGEKGPDGYRGWNDCRANAKTNPTTDDVAFVDRILAVVAARYPVDRARIYATGTSNGGNFTYRLAQERTRVFAAVAPIVAAMPVQNKCGAPEGAISLLIMNGTADPILPFRGGAVGRRERDREERGSVLSAHDSVLFWVRQNGTATQPVTGELPDRDPNDGGRIRVERYAGGHDGSEVLLYAVEGGGHTEPSPSQRYGWLYRRIVGAQNHDIEMAEIVWRFFQRHHR